MGENPGNWFVALPTACTYHVSFGVHLQRCPQTVIVPQRTRVWAHESESQDLPADPLKVVDPNKEHSCPKGT